MINLPILYHTDGCHLCEEAMALLQQCQVEYKLVDIISDEYLVALFGTYIPVLENEKGQFLNWPFVHSEIKAFLAV